MNARYLMVIPICIGILFLNNVLSQRKAAQTVNENPKLIFERLITLISTDIKMVKHMDCHNEDDFQLPGEAYETCFAYKWYAPAWQTYVEKVAAEELGGIQSAENDYGIPTIDYFLKKNKEFGVGFIYRPIERSPFLSQFKDLDGYRAQIRMTVSR